MTGDHKRSDLEDEDNPCEQCGHPKPRLLFDQLSQLLLCEACLDRMQQRQAWELLRVTDLA